MLLYLLRHADAENVAASDEERPLSAKGNGQAKRMGKFCAEMGFKPDLILTSPLVRARQTAGHVAAALGEVTPEVTWFLASGMYPETAFNELKAYRNLDSLMIVGHEPDFSMLCAYLLGMGPNARINIRKASLTLINLQDWKAGTGVLEFSLPCRFLSVDC